MIRRRQTMKHDVTRRERGKLCQLPISSKCGMDRKKRKERKEKEKKEKRRKERDEEERDRGGIQGELKGIR